MRGPAPPGPRGPRRRLSGHRRPRAGPGHHHLLQAGPAGGARPFGNAAGHPRPRGFFRRGRAHPSGAGLRHSGGQRQRGPAGPYPDFVEAAGPVQGAGAAVREQDGPARPGPRRPDGAAEGPAGPRLHRLWPARGRPQRRAGPVRRGPDGGLSGGGQPFGRGHCRRGGRAAGVPLLFRLGPEAGRAGRAAGRSAPLCAGPRLRAAFFRRSVQGGPRPQGGAADLFEDHRRGAGSPRPAQRPGRPGPRRRALAGEGQPESGCTPVQSSPRWSGPRPGRCAP